MNDTAIAAPRSAHPLLVGAHGAAFGFVLSNVGFTSFDELHKMLTLTDLRMFFTFAGAVMISIVGYAALRRVRSLPARILHRGTVPGGVIFGAGWAIAGACPAVAFIQLGEGRMWAAVTLAGIALGTVGYTAIHRRWLRFDRGTCG